MAKRSAPSWAGSQRRRLRHRTLTSRTIEIPVSYGGASGPDLAAVAEFAECSEADVVQLHTQARYRVYMLGFLPGFAYMGSVDRRIAMPRLDTPRMRVNAGSVGIAGEQTGIYPCDTPGGWRIIGRTSAKLFDATRARTVSLEGWRLRDVCSRVTMAVLSILRPGMFTTVQDLGRWGFQSRGVPVSGALDWYSHRLANQFAGE